jgi:hypothetical protein
VVLELGGSHLALVARQELLVLPAAVQSILVEQQVLVALVALVAQILVLVGHLRLALVVLE